MDGNRIAPKYLVDRPLEKKRPDLDRAIEDAQAAPKTNSNSRKRAGLLNAKQNSAPDESAGKTRESEIESTRFSFREGYSTEVTEHNMVTASQAALPGDEANNEMLRVYFQALPQIMTSIRTFFDQIRGTTSYQVQDLLDEEKTYSMASDEKEVAIKIEPHGLDEFSLTFDDFFVYTFKVTNETAQLFRFGLKNTEGKNDIAISVQGKGIAPENFHFNLKPTWKPASGGSGDSAHPQFAANFLAANKI